MHPFRSAHRPIALTLLLATAFFFPKKAFAHGDELPTGKVAADLFTVYGQSDKYELTLYYPTLTAGQEAHLTLYVADYHTNRPIDKADLKISTLENPAATFEVHPVGPGVYELHAVFPENKTYTLNVQVAHPNGADLIGVKDVEVGKALPQPEAAATAPVGRPSKPNHEPQVHTAGYFWNTEAQRQRVDFNQLASKELVSLSLCV